MCHVSSKKKLIGDAVVVLLLVAALFVVGTTRAAADPELEIGVTLNRSELVIGEQAQLTVTVNEPSGISEPVMPAVDGIEIVPQGFTQSMQITNMKVKLTKSYIYVVIPHEAGEFTIGPVQIDQEGKTYQSRTLNLSVRKPIQAQTTKSADSVSLEKSAQGQATKPSAPQNVLVEASIDNVNPFVGQQITLLFRFAQRAAARIPRAFYEIPDLSDFSREGMDNKREYKKNIGGVEYGVTEITVPLFPIKEGQVTIGSITFRYDEVVSSQRRRRVSPFSQGPFDEGFFDDDFLGLFDSMRTERKIAQTQPLEIHVRSLPLDGRPKHFGGGVGSFTLNANLSTDEVKVGESVTLTVELGGSGNIRHLADPVIDVENVKTYSDTPVTKVESNQDTIVGKKIYKLGLVPQQPGDIIIPPISVPYFNPKTERYEIAASQPLLLKVNASEKESLVVTKPPEAREGRIRISAVGRDIVPIHERLDSIESSGFEVWWRRLRPIVYPVPLLVYAICFTVVRRRERLRTDPVYRRYRLASRGAQRHMDYAIEAMRQDKVADALSECSRAVTEYLADKLNVAAGGLTPAEIEAALLSLDLSPDLIGEVVGFLEDCDFGRFASSSAEADRIGERIEKARQILGRLEREGAIKR